MKFIKMQALGNDYIFIDLFKEKLNIKESIEDFVVKISDRHLGIGSDGLILMSKSEIADVKMDIYNSDASIAKICGNGIRCLAKLYYDNGYTDKTNFTVETLSGIKEISIIDFNEDKSAKNIKVSLGKAKLISELFEKIEVNFKVHEFIGVDIGNPHAVYFLNSKLELDELDLKKIGKYYEEHERFPDKINSEFVYVQDKNNIYLRTYERGSGETLACGTGASASVYAGILTSKLNKKVKVHLLYGELFIEYDEDSEIIFMSGEAKKVFEGEI